ncbi:MAG: M16 family metallopeptidase [Atribacterota bacterium]
MISKNNILEDELDNGMKTVIWENHSSDVVELRVYVKAGSVYENEYPGSGVSHFLEHLTAEGPTKKKTKKQVDALLEKFGNAFNAYTSKDHTCYHITTTKKFYKEALVLLGELVFENKITKKAFQRERGVIQREIEKSLQEPHRYLYRLTSKNIYKQHPARFPVIGELALFKKLTIKDIKSYYNEKYVPNNSVVVIGGNISTREAEEYVKKVYGKYKRNFYQTPVLAQEPDFVSKRGKTGYRDIQGKYLNLSWLTIPIDHKDLYALDLLSEILTSGKNSRMNRIIKEDKQLVNSINSYSHTPEYGKGDFTVTARFEQSSLQEVEKAIFEVIVDIQKNGVTDEELEVAKKLALSEHLFGKTSITKNTSSIGIDVVTTDDVNFSDQYVDLLRKVKEDEVKQAADKYLNLNKFAKTVLMPGHKKEKSQVPEDKKEDQKIKKIELNNGITVILKNIPGISVVNYSVFLKGGLTFDKIYNIPGLFNFFGTMITRGTENYSREELAQEFENRGASFSSSSGNNTFYLKVNSLSKDVERMLELINEILYRPAFPEKEIVKVKKFIKQSILQQRNNWQKEAFLNFKKHIFPSDLPYTYSRLGTTTSVENLDRKDLVKVYGNFVIPTNTVISVVGDFKLGDIEKKIKEKFSDIDIKGKNIPDYKSKILDIKKSIRKEYNTGKDLATIFIGYPTVTIMDHEERAVLDVVDTIISGRKYPGGWLHKRLRGKKLVYVVHAYNINMLKSGCFTIFAATNPDKLKKCIKVIEDSIDDLKKGKYSDEEIKKAKQLIITTHQISLQSPVAQSRNFAVNEVLDMGYDFDEKYLDMVKNVSRKDIKKAVEKYFKNSIMVITKPNN